MLMHGACSALWWLVDGSSGFRGNELLIFVIYMLVLNVALGVKLQLLISANCLLTNLLLFRGQGSFIL